MVVLGGRFSHAVRKGPMLVRRARGGRRACSWRRRSGRRPPSAAEAAVARGRDGGVPGGAADLLYAGWTSMPGDDGAPVVIELELLEPSLFLAHVPAAAERLVGAIAARLTSAPG